MPIVSTKGQAVEVTTIAGHPIEIATPTDQPIEIATPFGEFIDVKLIGSDAFIPTKVGASTYTIGVVLDTSAYSDGDVLFVAKSITDDKGAFVKGITVIDRDDVGGAFDLLFFSTDVTIGTINNPPSIDDSEAVYCIGRVSIASTDYIDLGGCKIGYKLVDGLVLTTNTYVYFAGISRDTKTYSASGLVFVFSCERGI